MKVVVVADEGLKEELIEQGLNPSADIEWKNDLTNMPPSIYACIDLQYDGNREERKKLLEKCNAELIIINDVEKPTANLPSNFVRINAWPGFLKRNIVEASTNNEEIKPIAENVFLAFGKTVQWLPDIPGLVTARVISSIINEAYFSLADGVSSRNEIDTAMKLGTNYPYGPFEWANIIGIKKIHSLLDTLSKTNTRYNPSGLLKKDATI